MAELSGRGRLSALVAGGGVAKNEIGRHTRDDSRVWRPRPPSATAAGSSRLVAVRPGLPARPAHQARRGARSPTSRPESRSTRRLRGGAAGAPGSSPYRALDAVGELLDRLVERGRVELERDRTHAPGREYLRLTHVEDLALGIGRAGRRDRRQQADRA